MPCSKLGLALALGLAALVGACHPAAPEPEKPPAAAPPASPPPVKVVEGSIVFTHCPDSKHLGAGRAEATINKLVEGCASVPGGAARFLATLKPGGAIEIAAPSGSRDEGMVPICVLKNRLRHHLWVRHPCTMEVQIEEQSVAKPR